MSRPSPVPSDESRAGPSGASGGSIVMTPQGPMLRFENAVVEKVVTHVTRTTTSFAPIPLPRIPEPDHIPLPTHLLSEGYPLAHEPTPDDLRFFTFEMDGQRVYVQDDGIDITKGIPGQTCGPGWTRELPVLGQQMKTSAMDGLMKHSKGKGKAKAAPDSDKERRKRPHELSRPSTSSGYNDIAVKEEPGVSDEMALSRPRARSPPRKKIRASETLSNEDMSEVSVSSGSPPLSPEEPVVAAEHPSMGGGLEAVTLMSLASMVDQFEKLPDKIQQHALIHMLRRSRMPTIQRISEFTSTALRRDFISLLPHEIAVQILTNCDLKTLVAGMRVSKRWRRMIDGERSVWRARLVEQGFVIGHGAEEEEEKSIKSRWEILDWQARRKKRGHRNRAGTPMDEEGIAVEPVPETFPPVQAPEDRPTAVKHIFRRRYTSNRNWLHRTPKHITFPGHGVAVVTCVQFDEDKIVSASDDHSINIYSTKTGLLRKRLDGHEGGVWALEYKGDMLVSGSTDRSVRIWDLETLKQTHLFNGHTSTVRCLQIVEPVFDPATGEYQPAYPLIVTGSRDASLRVWRMPKKGETNLFPGHDNVPAEENPYHLQHLEGHSEAVRALAVHGRICVSGSYDKTVRVWDIVKGTCIHVLHGHEHKVYSIAYDHIRNRCSSGAMDSTVRVWDLETGTCLHTLQGHTSLVGLLGVSPNYIVSSAADTTVRIWDADTCELKHALSGHSAAITCFQHDENKVVSGSDGALKLWDIRTGKPIRDLIVGVSSVWQVAFNENLVVAASNRNGTTVFDVFDFGKDEDPYGLDDPRLDTYKRKPWERNNPHEPQTYQSDEMDSDAADADNDALSPTTTERWRSLHVDPARKSKSKGRRSRESAEPSSANPFRVRNTRSKAERTDEETRRDRPERRGRQQRRASIPLPPIPASTRSAAGSSSRAYASAEVLVEESDSGSSSVHFEDMMDVEE